MPGPNEKIVNIDTGDPGFEIDGRTVTYDVVGPNDSQVSSARNKTMDVNIDIDPKTGKRKDLATKTRLTLSNYLSDLTKGKNETIQRPNYYTIDKNSTQNDVKTSLDGYPVSPSQSTNTQQFANLEPTLQGSGLNSYSQYYSKLKLGIKKGATKDTYLPNGNRLLSEVVPSPDYSSTPGSPEFKELSDTSPVKVYTSEILRSNRFTTPSESGNRYVIGGELGKNAIDFDSTSGISVNDRKLKAVGSKLGLRASRELSANFDDPNGFASNLVSKLPGPDQLEVPSRFENAILSAKSTLDDISDDPTINEINFSSETWGALNNFNDQFDGIDAVGMTLLSFTLVVTTSLLIEGFSKLASLIIPRVENANPQYTYDKYVSPDNTIKTLGVYNPVSTEDKRKKFIIDSLGLLPTKGEYFETVDSGLRIFFGIEDSDDKGITAIDAITAIPKAATGDLLPGGSRRGFNVVTCRAIIRSFSVISTGIKSTAVNFPSNPLDIIKIVELLRSSMLFKAVNTFAKLGEIANKPKFVNYVSGSRQVDDKAKLSWASDTAKALYLIPQNLIDIVNSKLPPTATTNAVQSQSEDGGEVYRQEKYEQSPDPLKTKWEPEKVAAFEHILDSEYMPFSFQDLRTNEIVSFHAFLASLEDSYTASYDSVEAMGRVEPIKTYKGTHRKVGVSFYVVSTGESDFYEMYQKINKLTTLVYPQYTEGRRVNDEFIQPFSQLVGASPIIRIRLGDLFRSNYSKFDLKRLFGYGDFLKKENESILSDDNVVIKYFEESGGKGLAGHIESMAFDWFDKVPWNTEISTSNKNITDGFKAPRRCKVTIAFTPIHDITPGIDHNGYNRAMIYQVFDRRSE